MIEIGTTHPSGCAASYGQLGAAFFGAVSKLKCADKMLQIPRLRCALLVAQALSPSHQIDESGKCSLLKANNVASLGKKEMTQRVALAERMLDEVRLMTLSADANARMRVLGLVEQRVICHLMGKSDQIGCTQVDTLEDIGEAHKQSWKLDI